MYNFGHMVEDRAEMTDTSTRLIVVRKWNRTYQALAEVPGFVDLAKRIGFGLADIVTLLNRAPSRIKNIKSEHNADGSKCEDVSLHTLLINEKPTDLLSVVGYPPLANPTPAYMTRFMVGGEVVFVTRGAAELTYAKRLTNGEVAKIDLCTLILGEGDLMVSSDTPNNWSRVLGDRFVFTYFVGNPEGNNVYADVPKEKIKVK
jgi:hypothetical protein